MRNREKIDAELRLIALRRQSIREQGGQPSSREADQLLDEILAHSAGVSGVGAWDPWETEVAPGVRSQIKKARSQIKKAGEAMPLRRNGAALRRLGLLAAFPLSLIAVVSAVVVMFVLHRPDSSAPPAAGVDTPPPAAPSTPAAPKASPPAIGIADAAFIAALKQEGVPIPSQEYVLAQGHAVCDFLAHQSNFTDAVGFVQRTSIWDADQSANVTAGAIVSYCPQSRPASLDEMQPAYQKAQSDLQAIERSLQGIQGGLQDIQGGLQGIPGHQ